MVRVPEADTQKHINKIIIPRAQRQSLFLFFFFFYLQVQCLTRTGSKRGVTAPRPSGTPVKRGGGARSPSHSLIFIMYPYSLYNMHIISALPVSSLSAIRSSRLHQVASGLPVWVVPSRP